MFDALRSGVSGFLLKDTPPSDAARPESLTVWEREVLTAIANGNSNSEVAEEGHMSVATAKTHVSRFYSKIGARDRARLVVIAFQSGLVLP